MSIPQQLIMIVCAGAATALTRFLPFWAFPPGKPAPRYIRYLGCALPGAVFALLVVYCLKSVDVFSGAHGLPEAAGVVVAAGLYLWRRNMLLSIFASTAVYMVLVNLVFA